MKTDLPLAAMHIKTRPYSINVAALARCTGSTNSHLSRILNPEQPNMPSLKLATRMAGCLGVTLQELLDFLDDLGKPDWPSRWCPYRKDRHMPAAS